MKSTDELINRKFCIQPADVAALQEHKNPSAIWLF